MLEAVLTLALAVGPPPGPPGPAAHPARADTTQEWSITVAAWNLLNFGNRKAGLPPYAPLNADLLDRYAGIMSRYDIVFVQELLDDGGPLTQGIARRPAMAGYSCNTLSSASGRQGRRERYGICYATARIQLNGFYDYMGLAVSAVNGTQQTAQNVWMRPPLRAAFSYRKPDGTHFQFSVYVDHTKPAYSAGPRPPGTPSGAPQNSSVYNELTSLQQNLLGEGLTMVVGDLNADCASYPPAYRGKNFPAPWSWYVNYGEKTNTAPLSNCAYDRIILNDSLNAYYKAHGIYTQGIDTRVNDRRVSDHYLVWVRLGGSTRKRKRLVASSADPAGTEQRDFVPSKRMRINAAGLDASPAIRSGNLYIVKYAATRSHSGNQTYALEDVRGAPTPVTVGPDGRFTADVTWSHPAEGLYTLVLDVDRDGKYDRNDGDFVNHDDQADFIGVGGRAGHNDVVTLDDDGHVRELFNEDVAQNVYALARNLPANDSVDAYVVATKLLPPGFSWLDAQSLLYLPAVSIPVNLSHGPLWVGSLSSGDVRRRLRTSPEGTLFASAWEQPYRLMNTPVYVHPQPTPDYRPEYAVDDSLLRDPCENAWTSADTHFQRVCNVGHRFTGHYGTSFNVVLDVNRDGHFDAGDKVDVHDVGDLTDFFGDSANTVLDERANGDPAVGEYKEYLNAKLNLLLPLADDDTYDRGTRQASGVYLCTPVLPRSRFPLVQQGAQVGFLMLNEADYLHRRRLGSELYTYARVDLNGSTVSGGSSPCMGSQNVSIDGLTVESDASAAIVADRHEIRGTMTLANDSSTCLTAARSLTVAAGTTFLIAAADPEPVSKAVFAVLGVGALASQLVLAACAQSQ